MKRLVLGTRLGHGLLEWQEVMSTAFSNQCPASYVLIVVMVAVGAGLENVWKTHDTRRAKPEENRISV